MSEDATDYRNVIIGGMSIVLLASCAALYSRLTNEIDETSTAVRLLVKEVQTNSDVSAYNRAQIGLLRERITDYGK